MPENGPGSVAATAPTPEAGHSCGTTMPAKSGQISTAFSGHPSTQLQHALRYPRAAHKQQTCAQIITLCVTLPPHTPPRHLAAKSVSCLPPAARGLAGFDHFQSPVTCSRSYRTVRYMPPKNWETFDQSTLLRLKINCHKSIKTEIT